MNLRKTPSDKDADFWKFPFLDAELMADGVDNNNPLLTGFTQYVAHEYLERLFNYVLYKVENLKMPVYYLYDKPKFVQKYLNTQISNQLSINHHSLRTLRHTVKNKINNYDDGAIIDYFHNSYKDKILYNVDGYLFNHQLQRIIAYILHAVIVINLCPQLKQEIMNTCIQNISEVCGASDLQTFHHELLNRSKIYKREVSFSLLTIAPIVLGCMLVYYVWV